MIVAYAAFSSPPDAAGATRESTTALSSLPNAAPIPIFGAATDSADPGAVFSFSWSVLSPLSGQTASVTDPASASTALDNIAAIWGDVRLFLIATNTGTGQTSESDPRLAPDSAFITLRVTSADKSLTRPATGSRNWQSSLNAALQALEDLDPGGNVTGASVNGAGDLILTLEGGATINAGSVVGPAGANGADGANGANGANGADGAPGALCFSASINSVHDGSALIDGINVAKQELVAGPWYTDRDIRIDVISAALKSMTAAGSPIVLELIEGTLAQYLSNANTGLNATGHTISLSAASPGDPAAAKLGPGYNISADRWFAIRINSTDTPGFLLTVSLFGTVV